MTAHDEAQKVSLPETREFAAWSTFAWKQSAPARGAQRMRLWLALALLVLTSCASKYVRPTPDVRRPICTEKLTCACWRDLGPESSVRYLWRECYLKSYRVMEASWQ